MTSQKLYEALALAAKKRKVEAQVQYEMDMSRRSEPVSDPLSREQVDAREIRNINNATRERRGD